MNPIESSSSIWKGIPAITESQLKLNWCRNSSEKSDKGVTVLYSCKHQEGCQSQLKKIFTNEGEIVFERNDYEHDHENISDQHGKGEEKQSLESQPEPEKVKSNSFSEDDHEGDDFCHDYGDDTHHNDDTDPEQEEPEVEFQPPKAKKSKTGYVGNDETAPTVPEVLRQPRRGRPRKAKNITAQPKRQLRSRGVAIAQENLAPAVLISSRQCLFCWKPCPNLEPKRFAFGGKEDSLQLERHLQIYFILRKILDIQASWCEKTLQKEDTISMDSWLKVCDHCMKSVREGWKLHQKITALQEKFKKVKIKLKDEMEKGLRGQKDEMEKTGAVERVEAEIRKISFIVQEDIPSSNQIKVAVIVKKERNVEEMDPDPDQEPLDYGYPTSPQMMDDDFDSDSNSGFDEDHFNSASSLLPSPSESLELNLSDLISNETDQMQTSSVCLEIKTDLKTEEPLVTPRRSLRSRSKVDHGLVSVHAPDSGEADDDGDYVADDGDSTGSGSEDEEFVPVSTPILKGGPGRPRKDPLSTSSKAAGKIKRKLKTQIQSSKHKLKCPRCDHRFSGKGYVRSHLKLHKKVDEDENPTLKYFICPTCTFPSNCKEHMYKHYSTYHPNILPPWRKLPSVKAPSPPPGVKRRPGRPRTKPIGPKRPKSHPKPYLWKKCPQCPAIFLQRKDLEAHIDLHEERKRNNEDMNPELNCLVCTFPAATPRTLEAHFRKKRHRNPRFEGGQWTCYKCLEVRPTLEEVREHILNEHDNVPPNPAGIKKPVSKKSSEIPSLAKDGDELEKGSKSEKGSGGAKVLNKIEGEFKCTTCLINFNSASALRGHMRLHKIREESDSEFLCKLCPFLAENRKGLSKHYRKKHKIWKRAIQKCPEPNCQFRTYNDLYMKTHALTHHSKSVNIPLPAASSSTHLAPTPFPPLDNNGKRLRKIPPHCRLCPLKFSTYLTLQTHVIQEHPGAPVPESPNPGRFICPEENCKMEFRYPVRLKEHTLSVHQNVRKKHKCDLCEMKFAYKRALNHHKLDVHEGRVPKKKEIYKCNHCDFQSRDKEVVRSHKNAEHTTHICEECGAGYTNEYSLALHRKMKHESTPTPCPYCKKMYPCVDYMRTHLRNGRCKMYPETITPGSSSINQQQEKQNDNDDDSQILVMKLGVDDDASKKNEMKNESSDFVTDGIC